jgi:L-threonylcarbamoyladenylate synthase
METRIIAMNKKKDNHDGMVQAAQALAQGKLVVFPTETVYGLGANALDNEAVKKIFTAKGRPSDNPLIVHIARKEQLTALVSNIPAKAIILMEAFWPGPLTLVFEKSDKVSDSVTAGLSTVAVRMPDNPVALNLIDLAGVPVAAPSANISGKPSPTSAEHVMEDLMGKVDCIIDGGNCRVGLESTVLDLTCDPPAILRPGGITQEMIEKRIGKVQIDKAMGMEEDEKPRAPGMKYRHYAPEAEMLVVSGEASEVVAKIRQYIDECKKEGKKAGVLASYETCECYDAAKVLCPGSASRMEDLASRIYACLREFDEAKVDIIFAEGYPEVGIGRAIMNRLKKAAAGRIITV